MLIISLSFSYWLDFELDVRQMKMIDIMRWRLEEKINKNWDAWQVYRYKIINKLEDIINAKEYDNTTKLTDPRVYTWFNYLLKILSIQLLPISSINENNVYYLKKNLVFTWADSTHKYDIEKEKPVKDLCIKNYYTWFYKYENTKSKDNSIDVEWYFSTWTLFSPQLNFIKLKDQILIVFYQPRDCNTIWANIFQYGSWWWFYNFKIPVGLDWLSVKENDGIKMLYAKFNSWSQTIVQWWYPIMDFYKWEFNKLQTEPKLELVKQETYWKKLDYNLPYIKTIYERVFLDSFDGCWSMSCGDLTYQWLYKLAYQGKEVDLWYKYFVHSFDYEKEYDKKVDFLVSWNHKYFVTYQFWWCWSCGVKANIFWVNNKNIFEYKILHKDKSWAIVDVNLIENTEDDLWFKNTVSTWSTIKLEVSPKKIIWLCFDRYSNWADVWTYLFWIPDDNKKQVIFEIAKNVYCWMDWSLCKQDNNKCF